MSLPPVIANLNLGELSQPLTKLIEAVHEHIGLRYEPERIRRKTEAEAEAVVRMAEADAESLLIRTHAELEAQELIERAAQRISYEEARRQRNREAIVATAITNLPPSVSDEPVDHDWIAQFFKYSEDISDEEMQSLWARILASEVAEPGVYSRRTLHLVSTLSPEEAKHFETLTDYLWNGFFIYYTSSVEEYFQERGIRYWELRQLESIGLINLNLKMTSELDENGTKELRLEYFDKVYTLRDVGRGGLHGMSLTTVGSELARLCHNKPDEDYLEAVLESWREKNIGIEVSNPPDEG